MCILSIPDFTIKEFYIPSRLPRLRGPLPRSPIPAILTPLKKAAVVGRLLRGGAVLHAPPHLIANKKAAPFGAAFWYHMIPLVKSGLPLHQTARGYQFSGARSGGTAPQWHVNFRDIQHRGSDLK